MFSVHLISISIQISVFPPPVKTIKIIKWRPPSLLGVQSTLTTKILDENHGEFNISLNIWYVSTKPRIFYLVSYINPATSFNSPCLGEPLDFLRNLLTGRVIMVKAVGWIYDIYIVYLWNISSLAADYSAGVTLSVSCSASQQYILLQNTEIK